MLVDYDDAVDGGGGGVYGAVGDGVDHIFIAFLSNEKLRKIYKSHREGEKCYLFLIRVCAK